jgi:amidohydrolase
VRAELDAVPVETADDGADPHSTRPYAHRCGHDAHMTMVAGLAPLFYARRPTQGRVILLFQPAEETGAGASRVIASPAFSTLEPDFAVALHNLPGEPRNTVLVRSGVMACASVGMQVELHGEPSHAAEPEKGHSPAGALGELLTQLPGLSRVDAPYDAGDDEEGFCLLTVTHAEMGRASFGVSPGHAVIFATLRAPTRSRLAAVQREAEAMVVAQAERHGLQADVRWRDAFPETRNDPQMARLLEQACDELGVSFVKRATPMRWSDDFGHFGEVARCVYFGLGIGEGRSGLHQEGYAFPDQGVMPVGVTLLHRLVERLLGGGIPSSDAA